MTFPPDRVSGGEGRRARRAGKSTALQLGRNCHAVALMLLHKKRCLLKASRAASPKQAQVEAPVLGQSLAHGKNLLIVTV